MAFKVSKPLATPVVAPKLAPVVSKPVGVVQVPPMSMSAVVQYSKLIELTVDPLGRVNVNK